MDCIYHGCALRYLNGTNVIIGRNEKCLTPNNKSCWKDPREIINAVKARFQLKNEPIAHYKIIDNYFKQRVNKRFANKFRRKGNRNNRRVINKEQKKNC